MSLLALRLVITGIFCLSCFKVVGADDPAKNIVDEKTVRAWLAGQAARDPSKAWTWEIFAYKHAHRHPGKPITGAELNEFDPPTIGNSPSAPAITQPKQTSGISAIVSHLKIRSSFDDTLTSEDPSLAASDTASKPKGSISDLTGALFSYTRDFKANSDFWVAKGAIIYLFNRSLESDSESRQLLSLKSWGFAPSVSFDGELNTVDPTKDKSSLVFRLGTYWNWEINTKSDSYAAIALRLYGTYGTDFQFDSSIPASELELEPIIQGSGPLGLASQHFLFHRTSEQTKQFAFTNIGYQLRAMLHVQAGKVTDAGDTSLDQAGFVRMGPKLKLRIDPLFTPKLTCDVSYEYLADIAGHSPHHSLFTVSPALILNAPPKDATTLDEPLIKLALLYQDGGLDLTKEDVRMLTVGLGVTY